MRIKKERAVIYFSLFLLFMLACTIVSRGIYAYRMPKVTLGEAEAHTLTHDLEAYGIVLTKEEIPITAEAGLLVERVCVTEGQRVSPGDLLFEVEPEDLEKVIKQAQVQMEVAKAQLADLNNSGAAAAERASQDLSEVTQKMADAVGQAEREYQAAQNALMAFPSEKDYRQAAYKKDKEYQKQKSGSDKKAFASYKKELDAQLAEAYKQEKEALQLAAEEKKNARDAANEARSESVKQASRALEDARQGEKAGAGSRMEQENQILLLEEEIGRLEALQEAEGRVFCEIEGYVSRILVYAGERTSDASALVLSDAAGEKLFQAVLPAEERAFVNLGDTMNLSFQNGAKQLYSVAITAAGELADGSCQVTGKVEDVGVAIGESGKMEMSKDTGKYMSCVPLEALHSDGETEYVFLVEEEETILGTELIAKKRKVQVLAKDKKYAALEDGAVVDGEQVIVSVDKEMRDGQRVRLLE